MTQCWFVTRKVACKADIFQLNRNLVSKAVACAVPFSSR
jgi:hypothetical protein